MLMRRTRKDAGIFRQKQTAVRVNFNRLLFKIKLWAGGPPSMEKPL